MLTLTHKYEIKGTITAVTGLHVGGSNSGMSIGSPDSTVILHPITEEPFIPGSSIKGKMRSLFELAEGAITKVRMGAVTYGPYDKIDKLPGRLFGVANREEDGQRPSRIIVRDALLTAAGKAFFGKYPYTEIKTEVVIDRITSRAMPRQIQRVPAGAEFGLNIVLNVFQEEEDMIEAVLTALQLLSVDYVGGNGSSRGGHYESG